MALFPSRCSRPRGGISSPNTPWAAGTGTQSPILCRARAGARWDRAGSAWWGRSTRGSPAPRLLAQHPIIARLLKDVAVSRRLLMPPHGNWEPGDFHPPHPETERDFFELPSCSAPDAAAGARLRWERSQGWDVVPAGGKSSESAELKASVGDVSASSWRWDTQFLPAVTAGDTSHGAFGLQDGALCS